jgi:hypothetical protein
VTRGKTALNRLRQVDTYIALAWSQCLTSGAPLVVDVGYGAQAWTALEMYARWLPLNPRLRLLGVEIEAERVAAALPYAQPPRIDFRLGGFNVADLIGAGQAQLIRAYNVLRQYDESQVAPALAVLSAALAVGGLLIEGTSNPSGRMVVFDVYRKMPDQTLQHQALVFGTNFREALTPVDFQTILPKRLIHHAHDPRPRAFFAAWERAQQLARGAGQRGNRQQWLYAVRGLGQYGYALDVRPRIVRRGYLVLRDPLG